MVAGDSTLPPELLVVGGRRFARAVFDPLVPCLALVSGPEPDAPRTSVFDEREDHVLWTLLPSGEDVAAFEVSWPDQVVDDGRDLRPVDPLTGEILTFTVSQLAALLERATVLEP
ncbi:MAG TPA: hypothetical protein VHB30_00580 [Solirubrobacteraceae bacterium]|jgi:hypothetical protein|nr:hypothetical protein [Solirubrobacteraceae bacterium]